MRVSLVSLVRWAALFGLLLCVVAVGLGRMNRPAPHLRASCRPTYASLQNFLYGYPDDGPRLLDLPTGRLVHLALPNHDRLDHASCAPWRDERGEGQVVGCWVRREGEGAELHAVDLGLARYRFPGGEPIDQFSTATVPNSPPCWCPEGPARIVFSAGDGLLYRFDFDAQAGRDPGPESQPEPLAWQSPASDEPAAIADPDWPAGPRFRRIILASVREPAADGPTGHAHIWWLRLDRDARAIVAAGRLSAELGPDADERLPALATDLDGRMTLAYLARTASQPEWELRLAAVELDGPEGAPAVRPGSVRRAAPQAAPIRAVSSTDGRWAHFILPPTGRAGPRVARVPLAASGAADLARSGDRRG